MTGGSVLLNLLGAIALLLWSTRLVKTGVTRAFGENLRGLLLRSTANRLGAVGLGGRHPDRLRLLALAHLAFRGFA